MGVTTPSYDWNSAYQPIYFGIDSPGNNYPWIMDSVVDNGGKAKFISDALNIYGTPPAKYLYVPTGTYAGVIPITSIDSNGDILTEVPYAGNQSSITSKILVNYKYRIHYGYPTQDDSVDLSPLYKSDGTLVVDVQEILKSLFTIQPPTPGFDNNMFKHFRIQIIAADDFQEFCDDNSLDSDDLIETYTLYDYTSNANKWYLANSVVAHEELNTTYLANDAVLSFETPITFQNQCTMVSKIWGDRIYNIITCFGDAIVPTISISPSSLSAAEIGVPYSVAIMASGGNPGYTYTLDSGSLPSWATLNPSTGVLSGTPDVESSETFTIKATDALGAIGLQEYTLVTDYAAEVLDYRDRVEGAGGTVNDSKMMIYQDFYLAISSIRNKIARINFFGSDAFAAFNVPFLHSLDGVTVLGNALDTNSNFVSGDWSLAGGLGDTSNSTKFLNTGIVANAIAALLADDYTLGFWSDTATNDNFVGCIGDDLYSFVGTNNASGNAVYRISQQGDNATPSGVDSTGLWIATRDGDGKTRLNRNGTPLQEVTAAAGSESSVAVTVFKENWNGTFCKKKSFGYVIGLGLSDSEITTLYNAWNTLNTAFGR